eukprot:Nitzschia sp. Nitz4//scaffold246_size28974//2563//4395//NITZ4_008080-RA/size28974-snap-gene-0.3-mRNA-1//-1//CDS//3329543906//2391//frame0
MAELTTTPSLAPTIKNLTESFIEAELAEEEHQFDALSALLLNLVIIGCLLLAYFVKKFKIYSLPESGGALVVGMIIGAIIRLTTDKLALFEFSPEVFFFFLLPPIIFEAGYSLDRKGFFENIGAITLYAMLGTLISTFVVGILCFHAAKVGMIQGIDKENPMESLMFGSLISAVDPVATLSIMGNAELGVDPLLYSLVFGESVLNDAIAISLFKTFFEYYKPEGPKWSESEIPAALLSFVVVSFLSILVGVFLGLAASWLYRHTDLRAYPKLETSLLFCFCYLCYATAEAVALSGIMALFFQGLVLSHYNSYNLSETAHVASEHIFSTFATLTETIVFIYMGMGVFTGRFQTFDITFTVTALLACLIGRFLNIIPLSLLANLCRRGRSAITLNHQAVLWFAGLRGAIAFALSENMPGPHKEVYQTGTLSICVFTTLVCGGFTEKVLTIFGMKEDRNNIFMDGEGHDLQLNRLTYKPPTPQRGESRIETRRRRIREGIKGLWYRFDDHVLKPHFGGDASGTQTPLNGSSPKSSSHDDGNSASSIELGRVPNGRVRPPSFNSSENEDEEDEEFAQQTSLLR